MGIILYSRRGVDRIFNSDKDYKAFWRSQKISELTPIRYVPVSLSLRTDLDEIVDEPLINSVDRLNRLNIDTLSSQVRKETKKGTFAFIKIDGRALSEDNRKWLETLRKNFPKKVTLNKKRNETGKLSSVVLHMPVNNDTTFGEVEDYFMEMISPLKIQDVPEEDVDMPFDEIRAEVSNVWRRKQEDISEDSNVVSIMQFYKVDGKWYRNRDVYLRHKNYLDSLERQQDTQIRQEVES